ncbi:hypothetical protein LTSEUGA_0337 [Salmonella enterica subsp. enterica serovar Uganda str. R8-3404]|uniref:Uncharacterized protein n=1 Tax=Salmonella enterica subsp. enterica serovar Uganda str. R8-3404 TaxID=913083 RepID=A0A6C8H8U4_SALET|nr:hypothetical protein LTSEUGA_0337 [Salmonella enterica subsp. enterica serovar Uganda str. R8-3404]
MWRYNWMNSVKPGGATLIRLIQRDIPFIEKAFEVSVGN